MKNIQKMILLLLLLLTTKAQSQNAEQGIQFFKGNFAEALAEAKKQNKSLFVDFYAVWCVPCKQMAKNVFTQQEVGDYINRHFISLQIDAEKPENLDLAKQYKVEAYPTVAFIAPDGKALSVNVGAMNKEELLEAAKIAAGESVSFEQLYEQHKQHPNNLAVQQALLLKAPNFLSAQDGMEADKWATRIQKLYKNYIAAKKGDALINKDDYVIIYNLEGNDDKEHKTMLVDFINSNLPAWKTAVGDAAAYYVVMANDAWAEDLAKDGNAKYKEYVEKVKQQYADAYAVTGLTTLTPYERAKMYNDALYALYKNKDVSGYIKSMNTLLQKLGDKAAPADYGKAAQDLYQAAGKKLNADNHRQAIQWVQKALQGDDAVMERVNYLVMIGDSYKNLKDYAKAREYYNQSFAESLRMQNMELPQVMVQRAIKQKIATLELLEK